MSARDVTFTLMALGHVAGCRGKSDTEILAEAVGEIVRLETLSDAAMSERHEMHDRLLARAEAAESGCDKYKTALERIAGYDFSAFAGIEGPVSIAKEALTKEG